MSHRMTGQVNWKLEPRVEVQVFGSPDCDESVSVTLDALIDTGFTGGISTSLDVIRSIGADWVRPEWMTFANDKSEMVDVYRGFVIWNGRPRPVDLYAMGGDETNVGATFALGQEVNLQYWPGGVVVIADGWDSMPSYIQNWLRGSHPHLAH